MENLEIKKKSICLTTFFDKKYERIGKICQRSLEKYASTHGYDVKIFNQSFLKDNKRKTNWNKILVIQKIFNEGYDFVFWVDADAHFVRFDVDIASEIKPDKDIYLAFPAYSLGGIINNGVFLIKNSPWSNDFLDEVLSGEEYSKISPLFDNAAFIDVLGLTRNLHEEWRKYFYEINKTVNIQNSYQIWRKYLSNINISKQSAVSKKIGWLHPRWNNLYHHLLGYKYLDPFICKSRLARQWKLFALIVKNTNKWRVENPIINHYVFTTRALFPFSKQTACLIHMTANELWQYLLRVKTGNKSR